MATHQVINDARPFSPVTSIPEVTFHIPNRLEPPSSLVRVPHSVRYVPAHKRTAVPFVVPLSQPKFPAGLLPSGHTEGHVDCPGCQKRSLIHSEQSLADMKFMDAFEAWLAARTPGENTETSVRYVTPITESTYRDYAKALNKFFGKLTLAEIHDGNLRTYQDARAVNQDGMWKRPAGQNRIRKEIGFLLRMMKTARVWSEDLKSAFTQLPIQLTELNRALSADEQERLLQVMMRRDEWLWIYHYTVLALRTCASTYEMRMVRLEDIDLHNRIFRVGPKASKNKFRNRTIPLESDDAIESAEWLIKRAQRFGASLPEHYVFPFGVGSKHVPDATRPMTKFAMKHSWDWIRVKAGLPKLRIYDLRHTAITRMAETGIPIAMIMSFAGHITTKMSQHYTTVSMQAKRAAMRAATNGTSLGGPAPDNI